MINYFIHEKNEIIIEDNYSKNVFDAYRRDTLPDCFYITRGDSDLDTDVYYKEDCKFFILSELKESNPELFI